MSLKSVTVETITSLCILWCYTYLNCSVVLLH